jgi:hypothetical protein
VDIRPSLIPPEMAPRTTQLEAGVVRLSSVVAWQDLWPTTCVHILATRENDHESCSFCLHFILVYLPIARHRTVSDDMQHMFLDRRLSK